MQSLLYEYFRTRNKKKHIRIKLRELFILVCLPFAEARYFYLFHVGNYVLMIEMKSCDAFFKHVLLLYRTKVIDYY